MKKPKVVVLCGSTKFRVQFEQVMAQETLDGNIVISVGLFGHELGLNMNSKTKRGLDQLHFRKIDLCDEIFVINPGGYIGLSTCDEIFYAHANNKGIRSLEPFAHCAVRRPKFVIWDGLKVTAKDGLLWIDRRPVDLPLADIIAQEKGFTCAERLVKELTRK